MEVVIDYHVRLLVKRCTCIRLIFGRGGGLSYDNLEEHEIPLLSAENLRVRRVQKEIIRKHEESTAFNKLKNEIKTTLRDIVSDLNTCIVHNIPSMPFNFAATAAINELADEGASRFIFWLHDTAVVREEWQKLLDHFPVTLLHHKNENITFVTPTSYRAKQFASFDKHYRIPRMKVIPNGVSVEEYLKIDQVTKTLLKRLGLSFNDFIILTPVRILPRKNIELALDVVHELIHLTAGRRIKLLITGPPSNDKATNSYEQKLQRRIEKHHLEDNVIFCHDLISFKRSMTQRRIKKWSVADVYNIADLVFIPSKEEGFGLPIIEAGAARKPIFCSRIPPFQELIREGIEGYMFDLNNPPADIAFRIYRMMLEDNIDRNFNKVMVKYDWESIIAKKLIPIL